MHLPSLRLLSMRQTILKDLDINMFGNVNISFIDTTDYHVYCLAPVHSVCPANKPSYTSCSDLLPSIKMRMFFLLVSICIFCANVSSIFLHSFAKQLKRAHVYTVIFVNSNNLLYCIYLLTIWTADVVLRGIFAVKDKEWRSSVLCFGASCVVLWFKMSSQYLLLLLSVSRLMVVIHPLNTKFKETEFILKFICVTLSLLFILSLLQTLLIKFTEQKLPLNICLPFTDPTNSIFLLMVPTWFSIISQTASFISVEINLNKSQKAIQKSQTDESSVTLIVQFILTTSKHNISCIWIFLQVSNRTCYIDNNINSSYQFCSHYIYFCFLFSQIHAELCSVEH